MEYNKEMYEQNKEKILAKQSEYAKQRVMCKACNVEVCRGYILKHCRTKMHKSNVVDPCEQTWHWHMEYKGGEGQIHGSLI